MQGACAKAVMASSVIPTRPPIASMSTKLCMVEAFVRNVIENGTTENFDVKIEIEIDHITSESLNRLARINSNTPIKLKFKLYYIHFKVLE